MSSLITIAVVLLNPIRQLNKAKDARREHDLTQIRNSLDSYFSDKNCYPQSLSFGGSFVNGSTVYLQTVPQDPDFTTGGGSSYLYETDGSGCPQWNVVFAKVTSDTNLQTSCPLTQLSNCLPSNYSSMGYNYCVVSGDANCTYLSSNPLPTAPSTPTPAPTATPVPPTPTPGGGGTPTPVPTPTPTPTPTPVPPTPTPTPPPPFNCSPNYFAVSSGLCNSVTSNQCTIYGGSLTCYSGPGTTSCTGLLCTQ